MFALDLKSQQESLRLNIYPYNEKEIIWPKMFKSPTTALNHNLEIWLVNRSAVRAQAWILIPEIMVSNISKQLPPNSLLWDSEKMPLRDERPYCSWPSLVSPSDQDYDSIQKVEGTLTDSSPPTAFPGPAHAVPEEAFNHQRAHTAGPGQKWQQRAKQQFLLQGRWKREA